MDGLLILQPTTPFTRYNTICGEIRLFEANNCQSVLGVSLCAAHPMWCFRKEGIHLIPFLAEHGLKMRSHNLPPAYVVNGCFFLSAPAFIRASRALSGTKVLPLIIESPKETIDIDTPWDWQISQWAWNREY